MKELYPVLDLMTSFLRNSLQTEEKKFLMQEQSIARSRKATCHYLFCQAEHLFSVSLQFCHLCLQPFHLELLLYMPQLQYIHALHIFEDSLGCLFLGSLHFILVSGYGGFIDLNFSCQGELTPLEKLLDRVHLNGNRSCHPIVYLHFFFSHCGFRLLSSQSIIRHLFP